MRNKFVIINHSDSAIINPPPVIHEVGEFEYSGHVEEGVTVKDIMAEVIEKWLRYFPAPEPQGSFGV